MKISDHDEARLRSNAAANLLRIDRPAVFFSAPETFHVCLKILRNVENRSVCWMLDQNFVAGLDDRGHGEMIRHGSAGRFHHAIGIDAVMRSDRLLQRRVAVAVVTVDFEFLQINWQLAKRKWSHAARCEIEPRTALRLGPMHVIGMLVSHGCCGWKFCCPRTTELGRIEKPFQGEGLVEGALEILAPLTSSSPLELNRKRHEASRIPNEVREIEQKSFHSAFI